MEKNLTIFSSLNCIGKKCNEIRTLVPLIQYKCQNCKVGLKEYNCCLLAASLKHELGILHKQKNPEKNY
ncbi:hypothetical protein SAMN05444955_113108 [Lihuaxuella thermophila]|uniref:Uncharacterized protein n=1 Tax=Lihuaxuella thermophila TaxID=1173111 RepID=A0A1H8HA94_9BACL|nr:hypothetical protein SAMN05444955_113108 [Lihuaxuella thermophila]